ncbi:unnamed protein product [Symbiodinium pilosum]|uniref:Uncharacterized protein n=1 Tax=Symbiodinium pilosum TaxID=2952 RepID=A0A812V797_SYMPI|nr:unnamed protein product [Symbiodinium pilosum]
MSSAGNDVTNAPQADWDPQAALAPHLTTTADEVDFEVVVPTYRRWRPTPEVAPKKRFKDMKSAFILDHTLNFLTREEVPKSRVTLFVANDAEAQSYREALQGSEWADVRIVVSVPGIRDSRNFIYKYFPANTYVVSLDDDMEGIQWKVREGTTDSTCVDLPAGNFVKIIYDAYKRMKEAGAHLWGLSTSQNPRSLSLTVCSLRNGLINGYLHGFICRPDAASDLLRRLSDSVEDAEFSVRHFAKDGAVLRYRMYAGRTSPFCNQGGLQSKFQERGDEDERSAAGKATTQVKFISREKILSREKRVLRRVRRLGGLGRFMVPILKAKKKQNRISMLTRAKAFITKGREKARRATQEGEAAELAAKLKRRKRTAMRAEKALACDRKIIFTSALDLLDKDQLRFMPNTKTPGSASHRRYAKYSKAGTVKQAIDLGWRTEDRRFDFAHGFAKVVNLDTEPASGECLVEDEKFEVPAVPKGRAVPIRLAEVVDKNPGVQLSRVCLWPLLSRCPAFSATAKGSWSKLAAKDGLLAEVTLPIFRILLHWGNTSRLAFARVQGAALKAALRRLGAEATAVRIEQQLQKSALKFSASSEGGVAVSAADRLECAATSAEGPPACGKAATKAKAQKKRQRGRAKIEEPPAKVHVASLLQAASSKEGITLAQSRESQESEVAKVQEELRSQGESQETREDTALKLVPKRDALVSGSATPSTAAPESPTDTLASTSTETEEKRPKRPPAEAPSSGSSSSSSTNSSLPATVSSCDSRESGKPWTPCSVKDGVVAVVLGGSIHRQRNLKSLFGCKS